MIFRARWVLPIDRAPIDAGWIEVTDDRRIAAFGSGRPPGPADDLGDVALLPGLVNAHTHLELSWMAGRVPPSESMDQWIRTLMTVRRAGPPGGEPEAAGAMIAAAASMRAAGTVLVGDITNSLATPRVLAAAGLGGVVFRELIGFNPADPALQVREAWDAVNHEAAAVSQAEHPIAFSVVAHAPYSVAPSLFAEIVRRSDDAPLTVHLAESMEEVEFLRTGRGPMRDLLETVGAWDANWKCPETDPVQYLSGLGYLRRGVLIVHGVHLTDDGLDRLRAAGAVLVTCPRSNLWVGAGPPRLSHFYASKTPVAIGTDSLASVPTLSLFDELAEIRRIAPEVSAAALLDSATRQGAAALGLGREYGTVAVGKRAALIGVDVPASVTDVEEYLVGGISASAIRRVA